MKDKVLMYETFAVLETYDKLKYKRIADPYAVNVFGIRSANPSSNQFDDVIGILFKDYGGLWNMKLFKATTDPGFYWLQNPMNVKGTAILVPGQYLNSHNLGKHKGAYDALVQAGSLKIWRDKSKDVIIDFTDIQVSESDGINIHRASETQRSSTIDKWSAACQVISDSVDYYVFMWFVKESASRYGNIFTYTLFDEKEMA